MEKKVFLSHSHVDKPFVRRLDRALRGFGVKTFLDERDIGIGEDIPQRIYQEIGESSYMCYIISPDSINSEWVKEELSAAKMIEKERGGIFILPILIGNVELPPSIKSKRYADFRNVENINLSSPQFRLLLEALGIEYRDESDLRVAVIRQFMFEGTSIISPLNEFILHLKKLQSQYDIFTKYFDASMLGGRDFRDISPFFSHDDSPHEVSNRKHYWRVFSNSFQDFQANMHYQDIIYKTRKVLESVKELENSHVSLSLQNKVKEVSSNLERLIEVTERLSSLHEPDLSEMRLLPEYENLASSCQSMISDLQYEILYMIDSSE